MRISSQTNNAYLLMERVEQAMTPEKLDPVVARVALETHRALVSETPKRWFGQVKKAWQSERVAPGIWRVWNDHKVMWFLEFGTANGGQGYIYPTGVNYNSLGGSPGLASGAPRRNRFLYIPLTRKASFGWTQGMKFGRDYVLVRRVRGIAPRGIVKAEKPKAEARLMEGAKRYFGEIVKGIPYGGT